MAQNCTARTVGNCRDPRSAVLFRPENAMKADGSERTAAGYGSDSFYACH